MKIQHSVERGELVPGLYAAETPVNGWRILEWSDGAWWHPAKVARWCALDPVQWVGPLPEHKPKQEFDL